MGLCVQMVQATTVDCYWCVLFSSCWYSTGIWYAILVSLHMLLFLFFFFVHIKSNEVQNSEIWNYPVITMICWGLTFIYDKSIILLFEVIPFIRRSTSSCFNMRYGSSKCPCKNWLNLKWLCRPEDKEEH